MKQQQPGKEEHLERLFQQYPDLPAEVVVKEDILTDGLAVAGDVSPVPSVIAIEGGFYDLRRTVVRVVARQESPYTLAVVEGQLAVCDASTGFVLVPARPFPRDNGYGQQLTSSSVPCQELVAPDGGVLALHWCQLTGRDECKFCGLNGAAGGGRSKPIARSPAEVAEAVRALFFGVGGDPRERPTNLRIDGGAIVSTVQDRPEEEFYLQYVRVAKEVIRNRFPLLLEMFPKPLGTEKRLNQDGVDVRLSNLEVWDRELFVSCCPGKERLVGWDEWVRRLLDQVYVYGEGHVLTRLIVGLDMVPPWGSREVAEAVKSAARGFDFMILHGVIPLLTHVRMDPHSALRASQQPPVELFLEVDRAFYEVWQKRKMLEPNGFRLGPGRNRFPDSAALDVGRGTPPSPVQP